MSKILTESTGVLPRTGGPGNGHAAPEVGDDGRVGSVVGGAFRRVPDNLMESYRPHDTGLYADLYEMCLAGDLGRALDTARIYKDRVYSRDLREDIVSTDLDTALDGSVRTHVFDAWKEVVWPFLDVVELYPLGDFETHKLVTLSEIDMDDQTNNTQASGTLPKVPENRGFMEATLGEKYESIIVYDYGATFSITEKALRADDKNVLPRLPQLLGRCARRTVAANVAYLLEQSSTGPTMTEDSVALFNAASHSNLVASDITSAVLKTALASMAGQTAYASGSAGRTMGLRPKWLVVPSALELTAAEIVAPAAVGFVTQGYASTSTLSYGANYNILAGRLQLSVWPALTDTDGFFLLTDKADFPHIALSFLDGRQQPILETQGGMGPDLSDPIGKKYRVRVPHGTGLFDWRGIYCSTGA